MLITLKPSATQKSVQNQNSRLASLSVMNSDRVLSELFVEHIEPRHLRRVKSARHHQFRSRLLTLCRWPESHTHIWIDFKLASVMTTPCIGTMKSVLQCGFVKSRSSTVRNCTLPGNLPGGM
jgi:hypothetical protein